MYPISKLLPHSTDALVYSTTHEDTTDLVEATTSIVCYRQDTPPLAAFLKLHSLIRASSSIDATVVDRVTCELRFNLIYLLQSQMTNSRYTLAT